MKTNKLFSLLVGFLMLTLFASVSVKETGMIEHNPTNIVLVMGALVVVAVVSSFFLRDYKRSNKGSLTYSVVTTNIFSLDQLEVDQIVRQAVAKHYGKRQIPPFYDALKIRRLDIHHIQYLTPTERVFTFFDKIAATDGFTNLKGVVQEGSRMFVIFGIQNEVAVGAAAADTLDILSFGAAAAGNDEFINQTVDYECNTERVLEPQQYKSLFVNDDGIKNYFRLPKPLVWEPQNSQVFRVKLAKAYAAGTHIFQKVTLLGFDLSK